MTTPDQKDTKRAVGRPRSKAQLVPTATGWSLRHWRVEDGTTVRRQVNLHTDSKVVARARARAILAGSATAETLTEVETFESAARRIVGAQTIASRDLRLSRLERLAFPILGNKRITAITSTMVKDVIAAGIDNSNGKRTSAVKHLLDDVSSVLGTLFSDNELPENVCKRIRFGGTERVIKPRIVLSDAEFIRFASYWIAKDRVPEVVVMAIASRFLGGMRTSDLHAWRWEHIDTRDWSRAMVPRPKTKKDLRDASPHAIDPQLRYVLERWWDQNHRPVRGPVFPARRDGRTGFVTRTDGSRYYREGVTAGQPKKTKGVTYAPTLRGLLWEAGVIRPTADFAQAEREARALVAAAGEGAALTRARAAAVALCRAQCEIQTGGETNSPVDFHSFRRANATAAARAGLTPQEAMAITDHHDVATYMGYVRREALIVTPERMLPRILAPQMPELPSASGSNHNDFRRARHDSNVGPTASEAVKESSRDTREPKTRGSVTSVGAQPPREGNERQNSVPLIPSHSSTLKKAIAEALDAGDLELANELLDVARRRAAAPPKAAE